MMLTSAVIPVEKVPELSSDAFQALLHNAFSV